MTRDNPQPSSAHEGVVCRRELSAMPICGCGLRCEKPLSAAPASPVEDGWKPIETAPKDGTQILVARFDDRVPPTYAVVVYDTDPGTPADHPWGIATLSAGEALHRDWPTHWQPLPAPPGEKQHTPSGDGMYDARTIEACAKYLDERLAQYLVLVKDAEKFGADELRFRYLALAAEVRANAAAIRALPSAPVGDGWVLVPREPTEEMLRAMRGAMPVEYRYWQENGMLHAKMLPEYECVDPRTVYDAALSAAPIAGDGGDSGASTGRSLGTKATGETEGESVARAALVPLAKMANGYEDSPDNLTVSEIVDGVGITVGDLRRAREIVYGPAPTSGPLTIPLPGGDHNEFGDPIPPAPGAANQ